MSWSAYADQLHTSLGCAAGVLGHDGALWAASGGFSLNSGEGAKLANAFKNHQEAFSNGVNVSGYRYITIKAEPRSVYGKRGTGGFCAVKTGQTILVGVYNENTQPGNAANIVEKLADYLIENGC